nr:MAG TPA: hypothetical protein [Caudoviricetes sp.]
MFSKNVEHEGIKPLVLFAVLIFIELVKILFIVY